LWAKRSVKKKAARYLILIPCNFGAFLAHAAMHREQLQ